MTIDQTLKLATARLSSAKISLPHLEAEILLSGIFKKPGEFLLTHGEKKLSQPQIDKYQLLLDQRLRGEPIAYLVGHKEFYGLDFIVNKNVLIPRPETELMVEEALNLIARNAQPSTLIEAGTGSGCIIISLAKILKSKFLISNFKFIATDISQSALTVARKNAKFHSVDKHIEFIHGNLLEPLVKPKTENRKPKIFLANLPYGWKSWKNNCSLDTAGLKFEPKIALFTGKNGLKLYEELFKQINKLTVKLPVACYVLCEFDPRQTNLMKKIIKKFLPQAKLQIKKDLAGLNRLAIIKI